MILPKDISVLNRKISVEKMTFTDYQENGRFSGIYIPYEGRLCLLSDKNTPESEQLNSFFHELEEIVLHETGVSNVITDKQKEAVCFSTALGMIDFIRNNFDTLKDLFDKK
jgi:hypothetical protein